MGIGRFAFTPILPMMQADFGLSVSGGGWLASANYIGYLVGALSVIGMRIGPNTAIRAGLLVIGLSTLAMGLEQQFMVWIVLRTVTGIASAWVLVCVSAWALERLAFLGRPNLSGTVYAGVGAGIVAAGGACLVLINQHARSADAWLSLGVISIAATAVIWPLIKASPSSGPMPRPTAAASGVWSAEFWRFVLCSGAFGFGYIIPATFLPVMAKTIISDPQLFGWAWPVFGAAAVISTIFAAQLKQFLRTEVYESEQLVRERHRSVARIEQLFELLLAQPDLMPAAYREDSAAESLDRQVCDYIAGMTDGFFERTCDQLGV